MGVKVIVVTPGKAEVCEIERITPTGIVRWAQGGDPQADRKQYVYWKPTYRVPSNSIYPYSEENLTRLQLRQERYEKADEKLRDARAVYHEEIRLAQAAAGVERLSREQFEQENGAQGS